MIITVALTTGGGFREGRIAPHSVFAVDDGRRGLSCQSLHETREGLSVRRCAQVCRTAPSAPALAPSPAPSPASPLAGAHVAWSSRQSPRELCRVKGSAAVVNPDDQ